MISDFVGGLLDVVLSAMENATEYTSTMLWILLGLEVSWFSFRIIIGKVQDVGSLVEKALLMSVMVWLITEFHSLSFIFADSLVQAATDVFPGTLSTAPEVIWERLDMVVLNPIADFIGDRGIFADASLSFLWILMFIILTVCFGIVVVQVVLAQIELHITILMGSFLLPFMVFEPTKFIGGKVISAVIGGAIKLGIVMLVAGITVEGFAASANIFFNSGQSMEAMGNLSMLLVTALILAFLNLQAPSLAGALLSGMPSLSAGGLGQSITAMASTTKAAAMVAGRAGAPAINPAKSAASGAAKLATGGALAGAGLASKGAQAAGGSLSRGFRVGAANLQGVTASMRGDPRGVVDAARKAAGVRSGVGSGGSLGSSGGSGPASGGGVRQSSAGRVAAEKANSSFTRKG